MASAKGVAASRRVQRRRVGPGLEQSADEGAVVPMVRGLERRVAVALHALAREVEGRLAPLLGPLRVRLDDAAHLLCRALTARYTHPTSSLLPAAAPFFFRMT